MILQYIFNISRFSTCCRVYHFPTFNYLGHYFDMKNTTGVTKDSWNRNFTGTVILVSDSPTLSVQHLPLLLQDVLGAVPGHWHHALPTLGSAGKMVLAR